MGPVLLLLPHVRSFQLPATQRANTFSLKPRPSKAFQHVLKLKHEHNPIDSAGLGPLGSQMRSVRLKHNQQNNSLSGRA